MTSISNLSNSIYLSWPFQLNMGFSRASLSCFCLCGSLVLVVAGQGPTSMSLSAIIIAVTTWTATQFPFMNAYHCWTKFVESDTT